MSTTVLQTKLFTPRPRPTLIARPRLIDQLNQGLSKKLTLISAPAGFGKTSLITVWIQQCGRSAAWISLDEGDNDPARFLLYLASALQRIGLKSGMIEQILDRSTPMTPNEGTLTAIINDIAVQPRRFLLVLDDYHLINEQSIHQALVFLLENLPLQMHLVLATRADLPFPVALLRGRGELNELRQSDLRFTAAEAAQFLNQIMDLALSEADVAALTKRTEGWITGLQMAAVSLQGREDMASFVQAFAGSDRYIADYLVEEVLNQRPAHIQEFLLRTAVMERFNAALCAVVTGFSPAEAQLILEELDHDNLFVIALDDRREWYRYHRLFTDLLRQRLQLHYPLLVPDLHRRASIWYEEQGMVSAAIEHAFAAADYERAAQLLADTAEETFRRSEVTTFLAWCDALPEDFFAKHPTLTFHYAWALLQGGRAIDRVEAYLDHLQEAGYLPGRVTALRGFLAAYRNQMSVAAEMTQLALEQIAVDDPFLSYAVAWHTNFTFVASGDMQANTQALAESAKSGLVVGNMTVAVGALCQMARLKNRQGKLGQAEVLYRQALADAVDDEGQRLPIAGLALMGLGELAREHNDLETAVKYLIEGIQSATQWRDLAALTGLVSLVRARQAQGDETGADDALAQLRQMALLSDATEVDDLVADLTGARLAMMRGQVDTAAQWAAARGFDPINTPIQLEQAGDHIITHLKKYEAVVVARIWIAQDRSRDALAFLLQPLWDLAARKDRVDLQIETMILTASAHQALNEAAQAFEALQRALVLADRGGYVRIFVDEGASLAELLREIRIHDQQLDQYRQRLLEAYATETVSRPVANASQALIEPLSERELQILQLIADGLSNREIAQELILSLPTVKWHTSNIYGKLGVKNRTTAVAKARSLQILPND